MIFTLPQQQLARVNKAFAQGPLGVEAIGADNKASSIAAHCRSSTTRSIRPPAP